MTPLEELVTLIKEKASIRSALIVSETDILLHSSKERNEVYILELSSSSAAGGRAGGFGQRSVQKVHAFIYENGVWMKTVETSDHSSLAGFEPPYHAAAMLIQLQDGTETIVAGVVERELVKDYNRRFKEK